MTDTRISRLLRRGQTSLEQHAVEAPRVQPTVAAQQSPRQAPVQREEKYEVKQAPAKSDESVFSAGLHFDAATGDMTSDDSIRIEGALSFPGTIRCRILTVIEGASLKGNVVAMTVINKGLIDGSVSCENIGIYDTATQLGTLTTKILGIQNGAVVRAVIECDKNEQRVQSAPSTGNQSPTTRATEAAFAEDFGNVVRMGAKL